MREAQLPDVVAQQGHAVAQQRHTEAKNSELRSPEHLLERKFRSAPEHLLERKKKMWGISTKMLVLNVNFDKWVFGLRTSKSSKKRAQAKSLHADNQYVNYQVTAQRVEPLVLRSEAVKQGGRSSRRSDGTSASAKGLSKVLILTSSLVRTVWYASIETLHA